MVKVSVIIPNYNRAAVIGETIENMLRQSLSPEEVIVVDDGSTDDSISVIQSFGHWVTLIQQPNKGPGAARNAGLQMASGELIQFMDSDDLASLNKLAVQSQHLLQRGADIIYGPWAKAWLNNQKVKLQNIVLQQRSLPKSHSPLMWFLTDWSMVFQQCLVRHRLLEQVGGYREDMRFMEDGELFVRLLLAGGQLIHETETLTLYRLEDLGKLTASGQQQCQRLIDQAKFYLELVELAEANPDLQPCLNHPTFQYRVWKTWHILQQTSAANSAWTQSLHQIVGWRRWLNPAWQWLQQKQKGLQQRLQGHRWPVCYQARPISYQQKVLIQDMGWQLVS